MKTDLVFVYGSLLSGLGNHRCLRGAEKVGEWITPPQYKMFDLGMFPAICLGGDTPIKGEVYRIDEAILKRLDVLEGEGTFYHRNKIVTEYGEAYVYYYDAGPRADRVADGDWRAHVTVF